MTRLPHPIPYQGSRRSLAPIIGGYVPAAVDTWYEPFAGSAAMSLWAAHHVRPRRLVLGDSLAPMAALWTEIIETPADAAQRYRTVWTGQRADDAGYFNAIRARFNALRDPVDLLYLLCRCVKNAVRFNAKGSFTQSVDKRRLGMHPDRMTAAMAGASALLKGRTEAMAGDWLDCVADAGPADFIYMDPPYIGTSQGRDRRYAEWMTRERLIDGLRLLRARNLRLALSYDGSCGGKVYGPPLPEDLDMPRLFLNAGRSSQATLNGSADETVESLYLSPGLGQASEEALRLPRPGTALAKSQYALAV